MSDALPTPAVLVVRGCDLLARPGDLRQHVDLTIVGDRVQTIEPAGARPLPAGADVLDGRDLLAVPGLVNAHTHSPENCLRGIAEGRPLEAWLHQLYAAGGTYAPADHYVCALAGAVEMLRTGTTSCLDHLWMTPPSLDAADAVLRAYRDAGIRAAVAPLMSDADATESLAGANGVDTGDLWRHVQRLPAAELVGLLDAVADRWHGAEGGRLRVLAGPSGLQWCSQQLVEGLVDVARRHGSGVHLHLLETAVQDASIRRTEGVGAVETLDRLGVLGSECSLAHAVWLTPADVALIAQRRAVVVHNPASNLRLGSGRAPIRRLLDAGATVALGTDGAASSDNQDMWAAVKLASLVHRGVHDDGVTAREALTMASAAGAAALGVPGLGRLEAGALADVALLDRLGAGLAGAQDAEVALALSETGQGVRHVLVGGRVVVRDRRCVTVDEAAVYGALREQAARRHQDYLASDAEGDRAERAFRTLAGALRTAPGAGPESPVSLAP